MIQIYNSLTRGKTPLKPRTPGKIGIYVCGITAYDYCHLGHARMLIVFDIVTRYLRSQNYQVTYVRNITDIDDKIIQRAAEQNINWQDLVTKFVEAAHEDEKKLHILPPDIEPFATQHIAEMQNIIDKLLQKNIAYIGNNGDVYFKVAQFPEYGKLSKQDIHSLKAGARVNIENEKENPLDFVLWKQAKPGEPFWSSPWGNGRPGWHIECSAMSGKYLGESFDIHGGGFDLQFPHHENEIAQSECANDCELASIWMHNGFVRVNEEKMSKSLGNFLTIRDLLKTHHPEALRFIVATSHYRSPLDFSEDLLTQAANSLQRFYQALRGLTLEKATEAQNTVFEKDFHEAMADDFNTPQALAVLFDLANEINRLKLSDTIYAASLGLLLIRLGQILGMLFESPEHFFHTGTATDSISAEKIEALIQERQQARQNKDWARADAIRDELLAHHIALEDLATETVWRRV